MLTIAASLVGLFGCALAASTDTGPLGTGWLLLVTAFVVTGLGLAAARMIRPGPVVHCYEHGAVVESRTGTSPLLTLHRTDLVQGLKVVDQERLRQLRLPDRETVVEIPRYMTQFFPEVADGGRS
jgi:hypothetical protein